MKPDLKIDFVDFWYAFSKTESYFYKLLSRNYNVIISDEPEILFYSCYGSTYLGYDCIRVFYTAENTRPDFTGCDYAITFDHIQRDNHYRLPLYGLYIDHQYYSGSRSKTLEEFTRTRSREELEAIWLAKTRFCSMVVSNPKSKKRLNFFTRLSRIKRVDSGGKTMNNMGGPVHDKLTFINDYRFVIAFENASYPGYTTEKLVEPLLMDSIPLYWGNPKVALDFNTKRFINYDDFATEQDFIDKILEIDNDPSKAIDMLAEPVFPGNKIPECIKAENVLAFLEKIIASKKSLIPVARTYQRHVHLIKRKKNRLIHLIEAGLGMDKR